MTDEELLRELDFMLYCGRNLYSHDLVIIEEVKQRLIVLIEENKRLKNETDVG